MERDRRTCARQRAHARHLRHLHNLRCIICPEISLLSPPAQSLVIISPFFCKSLGFACQSGAAALFLPPHKSSTRNLTGESFHAFSNSVCTHLPSFFCAFKLS